MKSINIRKVSNGFVVYINDPANTGTGSIKYNAAAQQVSLMNSSDRELVFESSARLIEFIQMEFAQFKDVN